MAALQVFFAKKLESCFQSVARSDSRKPKLGLDTYNMGKWETPGMGNSHDILFAMQDLRFPMTCRVLYRSWQSMVACVLATYFVEGHLTLLVPDG